MRTAVINAVGDVDVPLPVHRHPMRVAHWAEVAGPPSPEATEPPAGERRDRPARTHLAHTAVLQIGDVDVSLSVDCHPVRVVQPRRGRGAAVPGKATQPVPANVVIVPAGFTLRTRSPLPSAM